MNVALLILRVVLGTAMAAHGAHQRPRGLAPAF